MVFDNRKLFDNQVLSLRNENFELFIRKARENVTVSQRNYLFGGVMKEAYASETYGHYENAKAVFDKIFAPMFLSEYVVTEGKLTVKVKRVGELSKDEMTDLITKIKAYLLTEDFITVGEATDYHLK